MLKRLGLTRTSRSGTAEALGWQQQRVAIAGRWLEAPVIQADEPTGNLDET
jgi:ABC-type lipoprotein export system ATPase subunit